MASSFQQNLRASRKRRRMTIEEVANEVGIAKSTYAGYESNYREPSLTTIRLLAIVLHVSADYLLGITSDPSPKQSETNLKAFLQSTEVHWDRKQLNNDELQAIILFIERIVNETTKD